LVSKPVQIFFIAAQKVDHRQPILRLGDEKMLHKSFNLLVRLSRQIPKKQPTNWHVLC
jgi:hypothetical protein